jgi:hypothetical protein
MRCGPPPRRIESLAHLAPAIHAEHERCDGSGYPDGPVREEMCDRVVADALLRAA